MISLKIVLVVSFHGNAPITPINLDKFHEVRGPVQLVIKLLRVAKSQVILHRSGMLNAQEVVIPNACPVGGSRRHVRFITSLSRASRGVFDGICHG